MSAGQAGGVRDEEPAPARWARSLVGLYPPAWRARYATEFTALLVDTGVGPREVVDVVGAAVAAWVRPAARLHNRAGRLRATVGVTLCAWAAMAAGAVLFAKLTRDGALYLADRAHPVMAWWYDGYALAAWLSALAMLAGGLPLAATMLRTSGPGRQRGGIVALLGMPLAAMLGFVGIAATVAALATPARPPATGVGPGWFAVLAAIGLAAAAACAAGPAAALHHARPTGRALTIAVVAGSCATALMAAATTASLGYGLAQPHTRLNAAAMTAYGMIMATALLTATTSCARGLRTAMAPPERADHAR